MRTMLSRRRFLQSSLAAFALATNPKRILASSKYQGKKILTIEDIPGISIEIEDWQQKELHPSKDITDTIIDNLKAKSKLSFPREYQLNPWAIRIEKPLEPKYIYPSYEEFISSDKSWAILTAIEGDEAGYGLFTKENRAVLVDINSKRTYELPLGIPNKDDRRQPPKKWLDGSRLGYDTYQIANNGLAVYGFELSAKYKRKYPLRCCRFCE